MAPRQHMTMRQAAYARANRPFEADAYRIAARRHRELAQAEPQANLKDRIGLPVRMLSGVDGVIANVTVKMVLTMRRSGVTEWRPRTVYHVWTGDGGVVQCRRQEFSVSYGLAF